jgi:hypothetical protein
MHDKKLILNVPEQACATTANRWWRRGIDGCTVGKAGLWLAI